MTDLPDRIAALSRLLDGTSVTLLSLTERGETLTLRRDPAPRAEPIAQPALPITAPCAGEFLHAHPLGGGMLAGTGQAVSAGAVLGLLRIGPLLAEVSAPVAGTVLSVDAPEGALVGYGATLFQFVPEGDAP